MVPAKARARSSYEPPRAKTERSSTFPRSGPSAPVSDCEPFSSWSKAASTGMWSSFPAVDAAASAATPACTDSRLSIRGPASSSRSRPR